MNIHADKTQENKSQSVANGVSQMQGSGESVFQFVDNRPGAITQRKLQEMANSLQVKQTTQQKALADNYSTQQQPIQKKGNNTGLPDNLKAGIENLSGYSMDDVEVRYNSDKPAQLNAHAYAQGTDIHVASGQEKYLPHEAWHVVQQKQGRVKPTIQIKGKVNINDDAGLEKEADVMGKRALQLKAMVGLKPLRRTHVGVGWVRQFEFRDMGQKLAEDGNAVGPQDEQDQTDKEQIFSQAFAKIKHMLVGLTDLKRDESKKAFINLDGPRYRVIIKKAPFGGKGSGAAFFTMELKRHVRKGRYRNFGKIVVKKMDKPEALGIPEFDEPARKKQNDEIGTLDTMSSHSHAPTFHGAVLKGNTYFVGMELAAGDLSSRVEERANRAKVSTWLRQTLQTLSHMHENNRAHGDVKGDNVMISQKEDALLGDFGETTNLNPDGGIPPTIRYNAQKDDIKRYIQMVYKNLFGRQESGDDLLNYLNQKDPRTALDNFCRLALAGCFNGEEEPPSVDMQTLAGQLNMASIWPG